VILTATAYDLELADRIRKVVRGERGLSEKRMFGGLNEVFAEEVPFPTTATVVGATVRVVGIDIAEHGEELTARCQRAEVVQDLRLSDLVFPADAAVAWIHAAYRRLLGAQRRERVGRALPCDREAIGDQPS
jgi:hypothetical protein